MQIQLYERAKLPSVEQWCVVFARVVFGGFTTLRFVGILGCGILMLVMSSRSCCGGLLRGGKCPRPPLGDRAAAASDSLLFDEHSTPYFLAVAARSKAWTCL